MTDDHDDNTWMPVPTAPIIESASGTTDPDNANSGSGAYVAFAVVAAIILMLTLFLTNFVGAIGDSFVTDMEGSEALTRDLDDMDDLLLDLFDNGYVEYESTLAA